MKKHRKLFLFITFILIFTAIGCNRESSKNEVSDDVQKIVETFMTSPNPDLYDPDMIIPIGLGANPTEEEKAAAEAVHTEITANWENALGNCFDTNGVETFLNAGPAYSYLMQEQEVEVIDMELIEKDDSCEKVRVTALIEGKEEKVPLLFRRNSNGKIWFVDFDQTS